MLDPVATSGASQLKDPSGFWDVRAFDEVDSTNTRIKEAIAQGEPEGTCFVARRQTAAYGRQGRTWSSPEGGLYFSFILDPLRTHANAGKTLADLPALSLLLSLAVQSAIAAFTGSDAIKIKWPNDILVVQAGAVGKLCGISLEAINKKLCCGIGINISRPEASQTSVAPAENTPAYLADMAADSVDLDQLLSRLLVQIEGLYHVWLEQGIAQIIPEYNAQLFNLGQAVTLEAIDGTTLYTGKVIGASETGELILEQQDGTRIAANSGEVHTRH